MEENKPVNNSLAPETYPKPGKPSIVRRLGHFVIFSLPQAPFGIVTGVARPPFSLPEEALAEIPRNVSEDASQLASRLYARNKERKEAFLKELLATYAVSRNKDFVVCFVSGGWGVSLSEDSAGWFTIMKWH